MMLLFWVGFSFADKTTKYERAKLKASRSFDALSFIKAIKFYQKALDIEDQDHESKLKIAESYRLMNNAENAALWYEDAFAQSVNTDKKYKLNYAQVLASLGRYDEAKIWYKIGRTKETEDLVRQKLEGIDKLNILLRDSMAYSVQPGLVNSSNHDFGPSYYKNGIVFASNRPSKGLFKPTYKWDGTNYLDLFYSDLADKTNPTEPKKIQRGINTRYHDAAAVFFDDYSKVLFTRNNYYQGKSIESSDGINKIQLYEAHQKKNGRWKSPIPFKFNSNEYDTRHPSITEDGDKLFFSSDRPGGHGGHDIWKSVRRDGKWQDPINMGPKINSEGNEGFPFIYNDSLLYFASDGHEGLGGLDLYKYNFYDYKPKAINLGSPINTTKDDFGMIVDSTGNHGYLSSNRPGGLGKDDVYGVTIFDFVIKVNLIDAQTGERLTGYMNALDDYTKDTLRVVEEDSTIFYQGMRGYSYKFHGSKEEYLSNDILVETADKSLDNRFLEYDLPLESAYKPVDLIVVENNGVVSQIFYNVLDDIEEYSNGMDSLHQMFLENRLTLRDSFYLKSIYYDFDKHDIRKDAANELDNLVDVLSQFDGFRVELSSHTDRRGSKKYNYKLASRRVGEAWSYLVNKGIPEKNIKDKYHGEDNLINKCKKCTEAEHQSNRRTEIFLILND